MQRYMEDQWENSWRMIYQYVFFYIYVNLLADVTIFEGKECGNTLSFEGHVSNIKGWDMHH